MSYPSYGVPLGTQGSPDNAPGTEAQPQNVLFPRPRMSPGDTTTYSVVFEVTDKPALLRAFGFGLNTVARLQMVYGQGTTLRVEDYRFQGAGFSLTQAANALPVNVEGRYRLALTGTDPLAVAVTLTPAGLGFGGADALPLASTFTFPAFGSVTRSLDSKLAENVSVMDFGAVGDGLVDDTAAFVLAAAALSSVNGGTLYIPKGRWLLSGGITIAAPNVVVRGDGAEASKILIASHSFDVFTTTGVGEVTFEGFSVTAFATTATGRLVIRDNGPGTGTYRLRLRNLLFSGVHSGVFSKGAEFFGSDVRMYGLRIGAGIGFNFGGTAEVKTLRDCYIQNAIGSNAVAGVLIRGGSSYVMDNVECIAMGNPFWIAPLAGVVFSVKMNACWGDNSSATAITLDGSAGAIHRVTIDNTWAASCSIGIQVKGTVTGLSLQACEVWANASTGIEIVAGAVITGAVITGNRVAGNGGAGISIAANVGGFTLANNVVGPAADFGANLFGIYIDTGTSNDYLVQGNRLRGNTNSGLVDLGSGVNKVVAGNLI